jgi:predicted aspartyl protease
MKWFTQIVIIGLLLPLISHESCGQSSKSETRLSEPLVDFPIRSNPSLLTVPVEFKGHTYQFAIDTGSSWMVFDKSLEEQLGASLDSVATVTGSETVITRRYAAPEATLGTLNLKTDESVLCTDLSLLNQVGVGRVYGLIGMSFLKNYALTIDITHHRVQLRREGIAEEANAIPIRFDGAGIPLIEVVLPGEPPKLYELDTGFSGFGTLSVERGTFDRLASSGYFREIYSSKKTNIAGDFTVRWSATDSAVFSGIKLRELRIDEAKQSPGQVGMGAIRQMNLVLDFPKKRMQAKRVGWW